jgi:hypothetical protein
MRMFVLIVSGLLLSMTGSARAHIAEGTVTMTAAEEVPTPTGDVAAAGGTAELELEDDNTLSYNVTVHDLTGPALASHIHEGAVGVPGGIIFTFMKTSDTTFVGTTAALTPDQVTKLLSGAYYVNVHTGTNGAGEIRGQITTVTAVKGTCSCKTLSKKDFRQCVAKEIKALTKDQKKSAEVKALKRAVKKSSCGLTASPKKKPAACCLPANDVAGIVTGELCAPVKKESQCAALGGQFIASPGCAPTNPCSPPASPSGAFVE